MSVGKIFTEEDYAQEKGNAECTASNNIYSLFLSRALHLYCLDFKALGLAHPSF